MNFEVHKSQPFNLFALMCWPYLKCSLISANESSLRPEGGGGVKVDFPVFTYLIRAAGDEQEEKNRTEI